MLAGFDFIDLMLAYVSGMIFVVFCNERGKRKLATFALLLALITILVIRQVFDLRS